jgi:DNA-binding transcriptional LysR family regulator
LRSFESFSRAAHALGMPVSTVSRKVTAEVGRE